jgi:glycosyltransferase involved in cell wall biosynthesis
MILDPAGNLWGSERVLLDFLSSYEGKKKEVALCCPPHSPLVKAVEALGITVYPYFEGMLHEKGKLARLGAAIGLMRACRKHQADIIYVNQAGATRIALFAARLLRIPVIPHVRLLEDVEYIESLNVANRAMPRIFVISKFIAEAFRMEGGRNRIVCLYDAYKMHGSDEKDSAFSSSSKKLCCAGRLVPSKGQDILLYAMAELRDQEVDVSLSLYGEGLPGESYETDLLRVVKERNLNASVFFRGFVENIPHEMRQCSAVICPSKIEPLGRVVLEAWDSSTLPIVYRHSGGAAEIVAASGGGILYDEQTPNSLAQAIVECLSLQTDERREMIAKGRRWLKDNCEPVSYASKVQGILNEAAR